MWIKEIRITNWRAYQNAVFKIPRGDPKANIVIIGAENGKGKTSLLEAVSCCLFGEDGASSLGRAANKTYAEFLNSAFCKFADTSSLKASVNLHFDVDDTHEISIERIWHFGPTHKYKSEDLFIKEDGKDLPVPAMADRETYLKAYIAEKLMPPGLLSFFLFDGVQVQQLAQRHMTHQVKSGIEGILGVPIIRKLIDDLRDYANNRRNLGEQGRTQDKEFEKLQQNLNVAESQSRQLAEKIKNAEKDIADATTQMNALFKQYTDMGGDDVAKLGELREQGGKLRQQRYQLFELLSQSLVGNFSMSLVGSDMLTGTAKRLREEKARADWERDITIGKDNYEKFITNLKQLDAFTLPLSEDNIAKLRDNLKKAWNEVWYPMPSSCAKQFLNSSFSDEERNNAERHLRELSGASLMELKNLRNEINHNEQDIANIQQRISVSSGGQSEKAQHLLDEFKNKQNEVLSLTKTKAVDERDKTAVDSELAQFNQEMGRKIEARKENNPLLHKSVEAGKAIKIFEEIINEAYSSHVKGIATEMTSSYLSMAHKNVVTKITIDENCDVHLLDDSGKNIRELAPSHGESEIFSLALISAIARVSQNHFPFIIDTPLANLDETHRRKFLHHFSSDVDNQILFLSTNEEIRKEQIRIIRQRRIAQTFLVEQELNNGHWQNVVKPGKYFWDMDIEQ